MKSLHAKFRRAPGSSAVLLISLVVLLFVPGCGAPGEPVPPSPPVPAPIGDLSARQSGDAVQLDFTVPVKTVSGDRLAEPPAVEIERGSLKPDGSPDNKSFRVVYTVPGALLESYQKENRMEFLDPLSPAESHAHPGRSLVYRVRTRASRKKTSAESNIVVVNVFPPAAPIKSVDARVTEAAIELNWAAPVQTSGGDPLPGVSGYRIFRGELDPGAPQPPPADLSQAKWKTPPALLAPSLTNSYRDTLFDFGKDYVYLVRSVVIVGGAPLESSDSPPTIVKARDTFPPAAPQALVAAIHAEDPQSGAIVELSWSINVEPDLAGYRVYRSEQEGARGQLLTQDLLPTPVYRDTSIRFGHRYSYVVTAVDRAGNESQPSSPAVVAPEQPSS